MAGALKEAALTTRNARSKLPQQSKPHWRSIDAEVHLGYRRGKRAGVWVVRWAIGGGNYHQATVGTADDEIAVGTLSYDAAVKRAVEIVEQVRIDAAAKAAGPVQTVESAVETYMAVRDAREVKRRGKSGAKSDARSRLTLYVLSTPLAKVELPKLKAADLIEWRKALPGKPSSKQRTMNDLRAALNGADKDGALAIAIKAGFKPDDADEDDDEPEVDRANQILDAAEIGKVMTAAKEYDAANGWEGDWFRIVLVMAATGARFSQIARIKVDDFQPDQNRLFVPQSRKGKSKKKTSTAGSTPIQLGADVIAELQVAAGKRPANAALLERNRLKQVAGKVAVWEHRDRGAWTSASEMVRPWAATMKLAKLDKRGIIPYALRHSSIVKGLRLNLPVRLVASLHDTSVVMIERHYSKWIAHGLEDIAARAIIPLVPGN